MRRFEGQDGLAFILIFFSHLDVYYYLRFSELDYFWKRMNEGGRKSFRIEELDDKYFFKASGNVLVPYLDMINADLNSRTVDNN